jgi:hypothetical protein
MTLHQIRFDFIKQGAAALMTVPLMALSCLGGSGSEITTGVSGYRFVASVDTMKESKDAERNRLTSAQIADDVRLAASLNTTHITVDTHMEFPIVMGQWVTAIRNAGKHVWFRLGTNTCSEARTYYLQEMQNLILSNRGFFRPGDIFDGDAEAENSCYWFNNCGTSGPYNCPGQFNAFLQNLTTYADKAFKQIGVSGVITWIHSTDPGTATDGLLNAATVSIDHNTVTVDAYPDGSTTDPTTAANAWLRQLQKIHSVWPSSQVVIGEAGYCLKILVSDAVQHAVLSAEYTAIKHAAYPWLAGWNYWVGAGGAGTGGYTNIFKGSTGNWSRRPAAVDLAAFYASESSPSRSVPPSSSTPAATWPPVTKSRSPSPSRPPTAQSSPSPSVVSARAQASHQSGTGGTGRLATWMLVGGIALILVLAFWVIRTR